MCNRMRSICAHVKHSKHGQQYHHLDIEILYTLIGVGSAALVATQFPTRGYEVLTNLKVTVSCSLVAQSYQLCEVWLNIFESSSFFRWGIAQDSLVNMTISSERRGWCELAWISSSGAVMCEEKGNALLLPVACFCWANVVCMSGFCVELPGVSSGYHYQSCVLLPQLSGSLLLTPHPHFFTCED